MSLGIIIKAPEGVVMAAESRVTLSTPTGQGNNMLHVNFDNANKLLTFHKPYDDIGVVTYGTAAIGFRTAQTFIPEFEATLPEVAKREMTVLQFAQRMSDFFSQQWAAVMPPAANYTGQDMTFNVSGFDDNEPYGRVYAFNIPRTPVPVEQSPPINGQHQFSITWGGQREVVDRLVLGVDTRLVATLTQAGLIDPANMAQVQAHLRQFALNMPIQFMPLQDCVNLATLFIKTTIEIQSLTVGLRGCGGAIDVAIITRNSPLQYIKKKEIYVE